MMSKRDMIHQIIKSKKPLPIVKNEKKIDLMKDELKGKNYDRISCTQLKKIVSFDVSW